MKHILTTFAFPITVLLALLSPIAHAADDGPKDSPDQAAVRSAAVAFAELFADADFAKAKAAFAGGDEELKLAQNIHAVIHTRAKLIAAVLKAMPSEKAPPNDEPSVDGLKRRLAQREVAIDGDSATVGPDWKLKKVAGVWKVTDMSAHPNGKRIVLTLFPAMTAVMTEIIPDVEAGKFKTPAEMELAMRPKMQAAMKEMEDKMKAATKPTEKPTQN